MMRARALWTLLALTLLGFAAPVAWADRDEDDEGDDHQRGRVVVIDNYGVSPFVYGGYSYVPLRSTTDFLGAALLWDSLKHQATVTYNDKRLGFVVGSPTAYYGSRAVALPVAPIMVGDQILVPAVAFDRYLGVPLRWEGDEDRVILRGRPGWGYYQVLPQPPVEVMRVIERGGPPPWAPAHGWRRKHGSAYYGPAPFVYSGVTYVPLRDAASIAGAALLWDSLEGRAVLTYNGREIGLVIGSRALYYGGQTVVLSAAPVIVRDIVYVPADFCDHYLGVPYRHSRGVIELKGREEWHTYPVASAPPGRVSFGKARRDHYGRRRGEAGVTDGSPRPEKVRSHGTREQRDKVRGHRAAGPARGEGKHGAQSGGKGRGQSKHQGGHGD